MTRKKEEPIKLNMTFEEAIKLAVNTPKPEIHLKDIYEKAYGRVVELTLKTRKAPIYGKIMQLTGSPGQLSAVSFDVVENYEEVVKGEEKPKLKTKFISQSEIFNYRITDLKLE
jgi:hypothetical protein